jgi:hypothetical protein
VIVTLILSTVVYVLSAGVTRFAFGRVDLSFPIIARIVACVVVFIAARPTFAFVTNNLRNCSQYDRFKRLFRDELGNDVPRVVALSSAEERLEAERGTRKYNQ